MIVALLVVFIFSLIVFVHELGHFVVAKRNGIEVEEFGFGFPPRLYGQQIGKTLYSINWLPLGGFVKLKGEDSGSLAAGSFGRASFRAKAKVLLAGVGMNLLLGYVLLLWLCLTGLPPLVANQFSWGQPHYSQARQLMAVTVENGSPAAGAGIKRGDFILSGNDQRFNNEADLVSFTKAHADQTATFLVRHAGSDELKTVQLRSADAKDGVLGVAPLVTYKLSYGWRAPVVAAGLLAQLVSLTISGFAGLIAGLVTKAKVSSDVTGPVGIVSILGSLVQLGVAYIIAFIVSISISLAVINVLPLPALDGGRLAIIAAQKLSRRKLNPNVEGMIHTVGFFALIALMLLVTYFDIRRLGR